jgi:hypothetical protein
MHDEWAGGTMVGFNRKLLCATLLFCLGLFYARELSAQDPHTAGGAVAAVRHQIKDARPDNAMKDAREIASGRGVASAELTCQAGKNWCSLTDPTPRFEIRLERFASDSDRAHPDSLLIQVRIYDNSRARDSTDYMRTAIKTWKYRYINGHWVRGEMILTTVDG